MKRNLGWLLCQAAGMAVVMASVGFFPSAGCAEVYGDIRSKRYHSEECQEKKNLKAKYRTVFSSEEEAGSRGYYPCTLCIPPAGREFSSSHEQVKRSQPVVRNAHYLGDKVNRLYHSPWCAEVKKLLPADAVKFPDVEAAVKAGFERCQECRPPVPVVRRQLVPEAPTPVQASSESQKAEPAPTPKATPAHAQEIEDVLPGTSM